MIFVFIFTARTSSNATIDSLDDFARYSDDGNRETEERVAGQLSEILDDVLALKINSNIPINFLVLEFELRKAHETIKALRGSLTEATGKFDC